MSRRINWTTEEIYLATELLWANDRSLVDRKDSRVNSLSKLLKDQHPQNTDASFRSPSSVARKIQNIYDKLPEQESRINKSNGSKLEAEVIKVFIDNEEKALSRATAIEKKFRKRAEELLQENLLEIEADQVGLEGGKRLVAHYRIERDSQIRAKKILELRQSKDGVICEVCGFSFEETYGRRGHEFIEVHHKNFLSKSGKTETRSSDLIGLCSNCHRMIHRSEPWLTPEELSQLLNR